MSRDEEIERVTVGEPTVIDSSISLAEYDARWPRAYASEAARIRSVLGERALRLEHVGSTSIPGLAAKPIIDKVLVVSDSTAEASYAPDLEANGYRLRIREPDWFEHRLFKGPSETSNLHVFSSGCTEVDRMLRFRDWLRAHDEDRLLYERTKRELAARTWKFVQHYADSKSAVVEEILRRASEATRESTDQST